MIAEARVHSIRRLPEEQRSEHGALALVTRRWIQGISRTDIDYWIPSAAPSQELLDTYRAGLVSWVEFEQCYKDEQLRQRTCRVVRYSYGEKSYDHLVTASPLQILHDLQSRHGKITLLCWENSEFCHRHTLKSLLNAHSSVESQI